MEAKEKSGTALYNTVDLWGNSWEKVLAWTEREIKIYTKACEEFERGKR